ncbi:MAG: BRCT domain-containing protein, partial [Lachnospiraceae bacterium]|nr:BRCT domain-containing protein [Lachnospiraceae bacterium]
VVTGAVHLFPNRDALKDYIEARGGKVASAVSAKTDYLINNDVNSSSGKNKKAKELNVPVISEEDFMKLAKG